MAMGLPNKLGEGLDNDKLAGSTAWVCPHAAHNGEEAVGVSGSKVRATCRLAFGISRRMHRPRTWARQIVSMGATEITLVRLRAGLWSMASMVGAQQQLVPLIVKTN